jgi:energy-coupling factor transport system substrate-specific component
MGPSFGFAMGALTLLISAALTAGFGPWLPYQMLAAGWVGLGAGLLGRLTDGASLRLRIGWLAVYAVIAGFGYGILLDLWEWPLLLGAGTSAVSWAPGLAPGDLVRRFGAFYLATSLVYDAFRAGGNLLLVMVAGAPVVAALQRFRLRFLVEWLPAGNMSTNVGASPRYRATAGAE